MFYEFLFIDDNYFKYKKMEHKTVVGFLLAIILNNSCHVYQEYQEIKSVAYYRSWNMNISNK